MRKAVTKTDFLQDRGGENLPALILEKEAGLAVPSWFNEGAYKESLHVFYSVSTTLVLHWMKVNIPFSGARSYVFSR